MTQNQAAHQRKPSLLLYFFAGLYFKLAYGRQFNLKVSGPSIKGPAVILSNHTSNHDYKFIALSAYPRRVTFLSTYHWFTFKRLAPWLRRIGAIPKYQFTTDVLAMKRIKYVVQKNKGIIFIAPEGTIYGSGRLSYIAPSICKMLKFLKVPVYAARIQGAGLGNAKWNKVQHRGLVHVDKSLLFSKEEVLSLDSEVMLKRIKEALAFDEFEFQKEYDVHVEGDRRAEGLDDLLYKCPSCGRELTLKTENNHIECTACKARAEVDDRCRLVWEGPIQYMDNYSQWYYWQHDQLKKEMEDPLWRMESQVDYGIDEPGLNSYVKVGSGTLSLDRFRWLYKGSHMDESEYIEEEPVGAIALATLKMGVHIELPFKNGHCRVFYINPDGRLAMKWHLASRIITENLNKEGE